MFFVSDEEYDDFLYQKPYYVHPLAETHYFCSDNKVRTKKEYFEYKREKSFKRHNLTNEKDVLDTIISDSKQISSTKKKAVS